VVISQQIAGMAEEHPEGDALPGGNGAIVLGTGCWRRCANARVKNCLTRSRLNAGTTAARRIYRLCRTDPRSERPRTIDSPARLDREIENIHQALDWAVSAVAPDGVAAADASPNALLGLRLLGVLWFYVYIHQQAADFKSALTVLWKTTSLNCGLLQEQPALAKALPGLPWYYYLRSEHESMVKCAQPISEPVQPLSDDFVGPCALFARHIWPCR
jgi:hypothetical protein